MWERKEIRLSSGWRVRENWSCWTWLTKGGERQACDSKMKVESDGLSLTFGHTSMTIFPQLAHKPSFQPTFLFKKEKEINFGWKKWFVAWS
jgi:hypothetical protein|tara:strand:+ start:430 stop:702 length:273 start_codon:yes stop_codon:yes gene_type:complete